MLATSPVFEVAAIKPSSTEEQQHKAFVVRSRQFFTINTSLRDLIAYAYGLQVRQITRGPARLEGEGYDLTAKPEGDGMPTEKQWRIMFQNLLADRFKLTFHRDKKELSVFAVKVAKAGSKLTRSQGDPNGSPSLFFRKLGVLPARNATVADLAGLLQEVVLDGRWLIRLGSPDATTSL